jgi:3',5'-cyclic-AMP phosphodiesterase
MLIAQLTDLHLRPEGVLCYEIADTMASARAATDAIKSLAKRPDMLLLTGDLADLGEAGAYVELDRALGQIDIPSYVIPGNHDLRAPMREVFGYQGYLPEKGYMNYVIEGGPVRIIALDTLIEHETGGRVDAEGREWLADRLAEDRRSPTVIMMHHQPILTGTHFDSIGIDGREALETVIAAAPNVERVICGHMHGGVMQAWAGTVVSVCPSTAFQFDLDHADPTTFRVRAEPPAFQLHEWSEATGLVTYTGTVGDFDLLRERPHK